MNQTIALSVALLTAFLGGCDTPEPQSADDVNGGMQSENNLPDMDKRSEPTKGDESQSDVVLGERLRALCDLPVAQFGFDSDRLSAQASSSLDKLAECFTTGKAKDREMNIIGHADPRGETTYNFGLGQRRAGRVAEHLMKRGVGDGQISTSSRGELDATGVNETGWARDRRVEISLAD